jgi:hypothetical protein
VSPSPWARRLANEPPVAEGQTELFEGSLDVNHEWHCASCGGTNLVGVEPDERKRRADQHIDVGTARMCNQCGKARVIVTREPLPR